MALSEITLTGGMRANLLSLQKTQRNMETTQGKLATGLRVQSALDDPINYFAAKGHRDRAGDLAFRKEEMAEGVQLLKATNNGIEGVLDLIASAKSLAQSARSADTTAAAVSLAGQYSAVMSQINTLAGDAGYKGVNLMENDTTTLTVGFDETAVESFVILSATDLTAGTGVGGSATGSGLGVVVDTGSTGGDFAWASAGSAVVDTAAIDSTISTLDSARSTLRGAAETFANNMSTITIRQDFTSNMINTLEDGAAGLTEADLNEEGANMLMLQTRQALGTTSLSMASQAAQSVLRLF